jgi:hypothetical protein
VIILDLMLPDADGRYRGLPDIEARPLSCAARDTTRSTTYWA